MFKNGEVFKLNEADALYFRTLFIFTIKGFLKKMSKKSFIEVMTSHFIHKSYFYTQGIFYTYSIN